MAKSETVTIQIRVADIHEGRFFIQHSTELTLENLRQETAYQIQAEPALVNEIEQVAIAFDVKLVLKKKPDTVLALKPVGDSRLIVSADAMRKMHSLALTPHRLGTSSAPTFG